MTYVKNKDQTTQTSFEIILGISIAALIALMVYILIPPGGMSRDEYQNIHEGMTKNQVMKVVRNNPESIKIATFLGSDFDVYTWNGEGRYNKFTVTFSENIVIAKLVI
jgi:hypothetical protein